MQLYEPEQDLDVDVTPGKQVVLVVNLEDVMRNGGSVELPAWLVEKIIAAWRQEEK